MNATKTLSQIFLIVFLQCLLLSACSIKLSQNHHLIAKSQDQIRIVTYNLNWGEESFKIKNPLASINTIAKTHGDIVLLQETTDFWEKRIRQQLAKTYPYIKFHDDGNAGGLGILSKYPFHTIYYGHPGIGWHPQWIIQSKTTLGIIKIANIHLTPPIKSEGNLGIFASAFFTTPATRLKEMHFILQKFKWFKTTVIAGDFNEGDHGHVRHLLKRQGFLDAFDSAQSYHHTWKWHYGPFTFYERFDRVFYHAPLKLVRIQVYHGGSSDHFPVLADFSLSH